MYLLHKIPCIFSVFCVPIAVRLSHSTSTPAVPWSPDPRCEKMYMCVCVWGIIFKSYPLGIGSGGQWPNEKSSQPEGQEGVSKSHNKIYLIEESRGPIFSCNIQVWLYTASYIVWFMRLKGIWWQNGLQCSQQTQWSHTSDVVLTSDHSMDCLTKSNFKFGFVCPSSKNPASPLDFYCSEEIEWEIWW